MNKQIFIINKQLNTRLTEQTRQPITIDLISKNIINLTSNINRCLNSEEKLRLESINEQKNFKEMISNISHDLRTPLTAIKGYQQLLNNTKLDENQKDFLHTSQKYTKELETLIEHFFEYSYLLTVKSEPHLEKVNITNLVIECIASYIPIFEEKNISVNLNDAPPIFVHCHKEMIIRVIQNLINNCTKHSIGDVNVKIEKIKNAIVTFSNNIDSNSNIDVNKLFNRFYTNDSSRQSSTGLGLSIVELLINQMNGNVGAYLENNIISIFIEIPLYTKENIK